jgi:O-antigen ligase
MADPQQLRAAAGEAGAREASSPLWLAVGLLAVPFCVLLAVRLPLYAVAAGVAVPALLLLLARPELGTAAFALLLYTNAVVVGVRFHGLPQPLAVCVPLLLLFPIAYRLIALRRGIFVAPALKWIALFLALQLYGAWGARFPDLAMREVGASAIEGLLLFALVTNAVRTPRELTRVLWLIAAAGAVLSLLALIQYAFGPYQHAFGGFAQISGETEALDEWSEGAGRAGGPIGQVNRFAQVLAVLLPICLGLRAVSTSFWLRSAASLCLALNLVGIAMAFSRGALVGVAVGMFCMAWRGLLRFRHLVLVGCLGLALALAVPHWRARVATLGDVALALSGSSGMEQTDTSVQSRATEMLAAALVFADHPWFGVGPGMFPYYYRGSSESIAVRVKAGPREAHNLFLGIAAEQGTLGLLAFFAILGSTWLGLSAARRRFAHTRGDLAALAAAAELALLIYLATGLFLHLSFARYFWFVVAIGAVAAAPLVEPESAARSAEAEPGSQAPRARLESA